MSPHLVRAQSAYKDIRTRTHPDTRTRAHTTNTLLVIKRQISMQQRQDLKKSEDECLTEEGVHKARPKSLQQDVVSTSVRWTGKADKENKHYVY